MQWLNLPLRTEEVFVPFLSCQRQKLSAIWLAKQPGSVSSFSLALSFCSVWTAISSRDNAMLFILVDFGSLAHVSPPNEA